MKRPRRVQKTSFLRTQFDKVARAAFSGYVYDPSNLDLKFTIDLLIDGLHVATARADRPVAALIEAGIGDGCYGFTVSLPEGAVAAARQVEARLANAETPVGEPIACDAASEAPSVLQFGDLKWLGGVRFDGWLALDVAGDTIDISVDQQPVMRVRPAGWTHVELDGGVRPARRLDVHLPERFANGHVHWLMASVDGRNITPDELAFVAFDNGLEHTLASLGRWDSERLRGRLFDQLVPASLPFSAYQDWAARFPADTARPSVLKVAVVLVGDNRIEETIESLELQSHSAWTAIALPATGVTRFDPAAVLDFLSGEAGDCDVVLFGLSGTLFADRALQVLASAFEDYPDCRCLYPDLDWQMPDGSVWPLALPAFDGERMLEQGYAAHLFALRRDAAVARLPSAGSLYDLFPVALGWQDPAVIRHCPDALAVLPEFDRGVASAELAAATRRHLDGMRQNAIVEPAASAVLPAVRVRRQPDRRSTVAIVIPTRNRAALLERCIESILPAADRCRARIVIVDNDSAEAATIDYLSHAEAEGIEIVRVPGAFNFARINNTAIRDLEVDQVCLLNNDIEALDDGWLAEMQARLVDPTIGAVGANLLWPSRVVQHGGVVLGPSFAAAHAFNDRMDGDPGYADMLAVARECSAVTAACLLLRRDDYLAIGGMDEIRFPVAFNDVDLCLKLRQLGRRIVFTPHARLLHLESASRGKDEAPDRKARFERELRMLRAIWGEALTDDPYYNPILSLDPIPFSALAWPPRNRAPRINAAPEPRMVPPGL